MIQITDTARDKIKEIQEREGKKHLRVFLQGFGWGGPRLGVALDEPAEDEKPVRINGIEVLLDDFAGSLAEGAIVDYTKSLWGSGFEVKGAGAC